MKRVILITITTLSLAGGALFMPLSSHAAGSGDCTNSYTDDGHNGPWRTTNNGGTWHGNTVQVSCPSSTTFWSGRYCIQGISAGQWVNEVCSPVSGSGGEQYSLTWSPEPCTPYKQRTHVENFQTNGVINKPSGGSGVLMACG